MEYICDNNKKLSIPKLYEGLDIKNIYYDLSLVFRIFFRTFFIFVIFAIFSFIDLTIGFINNDKYHENVSNTCGSISEILTSYDYTETNNCNFNKSLENRKSYIRYSIDKNGNVSRGKIDLYYYIANYNSNELKYIINSLNEGYSESDINNFVYDVSNCINNNQCKYRTLKNGNNSITFTRSSGYVNIHNK